MWKTLYKYGWYKQRSYERNSIEIIGDNNGILWLNKKHVEEGLDHNNLREITMKYYSNHRRNHSNQ